MNLINLINEIREATEDKLKARGKRVHLEGKNKSLFSMILDLDKSAIRYYQKLKIVPTIEDRESYIWDAIYNSSDMIPHDKIQKCLDRLFDREEQ